MIEGVVNSDLQAIITLSVRGPTGQARDVEAIVDTGYNGFLTITPALVEELGLPFETMVLTRLADGSETRFHAHRAVVLWDGRPLDIEIHVSKAMPLAGMSLLHWYSLQMDVRDGGRVAVEGAG